MSCAAPQLSRFDFDLNTVGDNKPTTTPVPILRFVDRQHPDGSYTYGYESGDGTYKIETRLPTGEVKGKYGYIDSNGVLREVEYGATPDRGFEPKADGLVVPPPTTFTESSFTTTTPAPFVQQARSSGRRVVLKKRPRVAAPVQPAAAAINHRFTPNQAFAQIPNSHLHPAQNIDLNTGSYTVIYSGK